MSEAIPFSLHFLILLLFHFLNRDNDILILHLPLLPWMSGFQTEAVYTPVQVLLFYVLQVRLFLT